MAKRGPKGPSAHTDSYIEDLADKLEKWIEDPNNFWLGKFASENGLWKQRLNEFADKNTKFSDSYKRAKQIQENKLFLLGLTGKGNVTMAIFALKNVSGWRDSKEEQKDDSLINQELSFQAVPTTKEVQERYARFLN